MATVFAWLTDNQAWLIPTAIGVLAHVRTLLPKQASGAAGVALRLFDLLAANYGSASNAAPEVITDKQAAGDVPRPAP